MNATFAGVPGPKVFCVASIVPSAPRSSPISTRGMISSRVGPGSVKSSLSFPFKSLNAPATTTAVLANPILDGKSSHAAGNGSGSLRGRRGEIGDAPT